MGDRACHEPARDLRVLIFFRSQSEIEADGGCIEGEK